MLRPWSAESRLLASDDCAATRDRRYDGPAFGTNCREAFSGRAAALWGSWSGRIRKFGRQLVSLQSPDMSRALEAPLSIAGCTTSGRCTLFTNDSKSSL